MRTPEIGKDTARRWYDVIRLKELSGELNEPISSDDIFKFMTYWVAFNSLYDSYSKQYKHDNKHYKQDGDDRRLKRLSEALENYEENEKRFIGGIAQFEENENKAFSEKLEIILYLDSIINELATYGYDKLIDSCTEILDRPVLKGNELLSYDEAKTKEKYRIATRNYERITGRIRCSEKSKITYLIMTIYQVRCNLFHGSKKPLEDRDQKLVYESSVIMEKVLRVIFSMEKYKPVYKILEDRINEFTKEKCKSCSNWGGAGLIISDKEDQKIINFQKSNPEMTYVINPNAKYVIWLINLLKPYANIDYIDKYEYYYRIGNTANNYFAKNGGNEYSDEDIKKMLNAILKEVKEYFE